MIKQKIPIDKLRILNDDDVIEDNDTFSNLVRKEQVAMIDFKLSEENNHYMTIFPSIESS